jgi:hypothetical protein
MGKQVKKEKVNHDKTKSERVSEMVVIMKKINELGIPPETPAIIKFKEVVRDFVDTGLSSSGKIPMKEYDRIIEYILTNHNLKQSHVNLKYVEPEK